MKLVGTKILVEKVAVETVTASGLIIPNGISKREEHKVLLIGNKVKNIKVGDMVRKFKFSDGIPIVYEGKQCLILNEDSDIELVFT